MSTPEDTSSDKTFVIALLVLGVIFLFVFPVLLPILIGVAIWKKDRVKRGFAAFQSQGTTNPNSNWSALSSPSQRPEAQSMNDDGCDRQLDKSPKYETQEEWQNLLDNANKAFDNETDKNSIVRGVYEELDFRRTSGIGHILYAMTTDILDAVQVAIVRENIIIRFQPMHTFSDAQAAPLEKPVIKDLIAPEFVNSVELNRESEFRGESWEKPEPFRSREKRGKDLDRRHPHITRNIDKHGMYDMNRMFVVYLFLQSGLRVQVFRTFSYDLAIMYRTQLQNMLDRYRMQNTAQKIAPERDPTDDYL